MNLQRLGSIDAGNGPFAFGIQNRWFALWGRAGGLFGKTALRLYALADTQPVRTLTPLQVPPPGRETPGASVGYLAVDPLASRIAVCWSGSANFVLPEWRLNIHFYDFANNQLTRFQGLPTRSPGPAGTQIAAFSPSGRMLAASSCDADVVHLIDVDSALDSNRKANPLFELESKGLITCLGIAWSPDGKLLARVCTTASGSSPVLQLWRLPNGDDPQHIQAESLGRVSLQGKQSSGPWAHKAGVAFSPDSDLVAVGGLKKPRVFRLYSVARREFVAESAPLEGQVTQLAFSPDGLQVFSGDDSGTVVAWRLMALDRPTLVMVDSASLGRPIIGLDVDRDAQTLCIASASKKSVDLLTAALPGYEAH